MAKGTLHGSERAILRDAQSGLRVFRLTHGPTISMNLYFETCWFTKDDDYVLVVGQRYAGREAPWDLFRVSTDGMELLQLTDCDDLHGIAFNMATGNAYYQSDGKLRRLDVVSQQEEVLRELPKRSEPDPRAFTLASMDHTETMYFSNCLAGKDVSALFKIDLASGSMQTLHESQDQCHINAEPTGKWLAFGDRREDAYGSYLIDTDGANLRPFPLRDFAHCTWFGETGMKQGTLLPPGHGLVTYREGDAEPTFLTEGRYYWHSSASLDAQWIVSDTNWPEEGLYLFHVPTRTVTHVCATGSSCSHPQWTHPHPSISPNLKYVLFNSDVTGVGQVYLAELSEEFLEQAASGYKCRPQPFA